MAKEFAPSRTAAFERKLAAIVAADVVGYSRLTGRDEEGAVRRLCETQAAISPIVEAAGGRTVNTAGDAMLLEFSSTVAALDCALAIQELVGLSNRGVPDEDKMLLRIGINVGDVIVKGGDVFGEVVNVASRLEAIAEPGGICVSHACYMQTKRQFAVNFTDLGEQRLKNIAEPVRAYAVRPPSASSLQEAAPSQAAPPAAFPRKTCCRLLSRTRSPLIWPGRSVERRPRTKRDLPGHWLIPDVSPRPRRPRSQRTATRSQTPASSKARLIAKSNRRMCCSGRVVAGREG